MTRGRGARCIPRNSSAVCLLVGFFAALACLSSFALERDPLLSVPSGAVAAAAAAFFRLRTGILARRDLIYFVPFFLDGLSIARVGAKGVPPYFTFAGSDTKRHEMFNVQEGTYDFLQ